MTTNFDDHRLSPIARSDRYQHVTGVEFVSMSNRDKRFLDKALELAALREDVDHHRHCAIVVKNGNILRRLLYKN